ncbi:hypothetical protein JQ559_10875 [Bradyrhizobium viridifuturi]|jgi:hypothetical protein|nr:MULTISPECIES: hypothetical protein [Bradyrhizobium]QRI72588.1 hypothetical protein JQ507_14435 [Bradyrhizobium sp. PSBB068]MBR1021109.1 hypothetical protein [Bradyrhizobium viridifuturi]MBR1035654.1 hypothetical protein [Bradyrhizobium viridifuturi]MBR1044151.1 hypothetical protein [Bradyrhizobium viridifuturi]MBR1073828.1 hypothetical protein [Bradyrhizobium viridifuturi]
MGEVKLPRRSSKIKLEHCSFSIVRRTEHIAFAAAIVWGVTRRFSGGGRQTAGTRTISE